MPEESLQLFFSYSHKDEVLRDELANHLSTLTWQGVISSWHDRKILPGEEWDRQINENLKTADIILLLVSSDFIASSYCWEIEVATAIERHNNGEACVIPILLRSVDWSGTPFAKLQSLPKNTEPITSWTNQDDAFANVAQGIRSAAEQLIEQRQQKLAIAQKAAAIAEYRQQVEEFAADGEISFVESEILKDLQKSLGLTEQEARTIRDQVLEPYGKYQENLDRYRQIFTKLIDEQGYPLGEKDKADLNKLQQYLKIKDEDVTLLDQEVETQKQQAEIFHQQREAEKLRQEQEKAEHQAKLDRYEQELSIAVKAGYPLDEFVRGGLKHFQNFLGLSDEEIAAIEHKIIAPIQAEYERQQQKSENFPHEQQESENLHSEPSQNSQIPLFKDKGDDLRFDLKLEFREAILGCEKEIRISHLEICEVCQGSGAKSGNNSRTCIACNGSGQIKRITKTPFGNFTQVSNCPTCKGIGKVIAGEKCEFCHGKGTNQIVKKLKITIPAGVDTGTRLRISQEGDAVSGGGQPGDLYVYLFMNKDKEFERDNLNILSEITINYQQALSGCRLPVNTVDGPVELTIPPKTQPNTIMKLKNRGVPRLGNPSSRGDHLIKVIVKI